MGKRKDPDQPRSQKLTANGKTRGRPRKEVPAAAAPSGKQAGVKKQAAAHKPAAQKKAAGVSAQKQLHNPDTESEREEDPHLSDGRDPTYESQSGGTDQEDDEQEYEQTVNDQVSSQQPMGPHKRACAPIAHSVQSAA
eukprot:1133552-Pelagomonas_calceolata.AAC.2